MWIAISTSIIVYVLMAFSFILGFILAGLMAAGARSEECLRCWEQRTLLERLSDSC